MSGLSRRITELNQQAIDYGTRAQTAGAIAGLGGQIFSAAGGFGAFGSPNKVGAPDAGALLKGVGE